MDLSYRETEFSKLSYDEVKDIASKCTRCELAKNRTKSVFGSGPHPCDLMLIGEAPGAEEDLQGLPFIGRAGKLLTQIFESVGIDRSKDVYIANTVKCRPPKNRAPLPQEQDECSNYLRTQIFSHVKPKIIILAGTPAVKAVLKLNQPITSIRGKWYKFEDTNISVMPIFHPAYLLRNPSKEAGKPKWLTWQDMKEVKNALDFLQTVKKLEANP